ncbi:MAG: hypothetical protein P8Q36_03665 [Alphaproteobacteria bacterium]|nr:hypothetical protein [Rhodospirillaceae bacterium]MDG2479956.1 hypothetical protein [Alphaproteobacteria bacterium]MBT6203299.1 hypothetical protein [Rhodospirillaceae bacterium]MBT6510147.1 hypothetical protein [Rhodospirillaceae bacterium]MBT7614429.1 hypothetical protein [Rhodospirillaceae bacterium]
MGKILWLASYPKSGNTWTRAFLGNLMRGQSTPLDLEDLTRFMPLDSARRYFEAVAPGLSEILSSEQAAAQRGPVQAMLRRIWARPTITWSRS